MTATVVEVAVEMVAGGGVLVVVMVGLIVCECVRTCATIRTLERIWWIVQDTPSSNNAVENTIKQTNK